MDTTRAIDVPEIGTVSLTFSERGEGRPFLLLHGGGGPLTVYAGRTMGDATLEARLAGVTARTLVLWGESDRVVTPDYGRAYSRLIPGSRFELIERAGHHPEIEQPEAFVDRVSRFLEE